ncbi:unnamed protein product [Adineta ricciae]|nr:unnamed protein product [Adineta ricciae]
MLRSLNICLQMFPLFLSRRSYSILKQIREKIITHPVKIDPDMQKKLERLSLLSFQNEQTIKKVEQTIHASDIIHQANVDHLEPLYTPVETELCPLRQQDTVSNEDTLSVKQVLQNATRTFEDYLVAPMIGKRESQTVEKMSSPLVDRLLLRFNNVKHRLEALLEICRTHEIVCLKENNEYDDESYRLYGPHDSDIEELEQCIISISRLIENLQQEQSSSDECHDALNYPLCDNDWTFESIKQLDEDIYDNHDEQREATLGVLSQLNMLLFNETCNQFSMKTADNDESDTNLDSCTLIPKSTAINLLDLPVEVLLHICSFMSPFELTTTLAPTCFYLANLILSNIPMDLDVPKLMSFFDVVHLFSHVSSVRSVTFTDWEQCVSNLTWAIWFDSLARNNPNLHTIRFHNILISPIVICLIVEYFPHCLQTIIFDPQRNKNYEKFDLILPLLGDNQIQLKNVTASYQVGITNFGLLQLINNLNTIVDLKLLYIDIIRDETMKILCDKHQTHLEKLEINGTELTDESINYINQCRKLESITIEFCINLTGSNFHLFHNFSHLRELCLTKIPNVPLESFYILFDSKHIFQHLILLKLDECHFIDDNCVRAIMTM